MFKRICLFVNLYLIMALSAKAQLKYMPEPTEVSKYFKQSSGPTTFQEKLDSLKQRPVKILPSDHYVRGLGFFCKKELQLEKATKIPFRFRLGSIDYTDQLEGKRPKHP
jgi:hypothetical protein